MIAQVISAALMIALGQPLWAAVDKDPVTESKDIPLTENQGHFFIEFLNYQDYVYSQSKKTELGDKVELDLALRYQYDANTFGRIRFETDPAENRFNNKTSKFEFLFGHQLSDWYFQFDADLLTDDGDSGGTSVGFDLDSELTQVAWSLNPYTKFIFYPFNFNGEVGHDFNTWDVTRIYFVDGSPSTINNTPALDEKIVAKTIPGFELQYRDKSAEVESMAYVGFGAATFLYPANSDFDVDTVPTADRWVREEDFGYKVGALYRTPQHRYELAYVAHTEPEKTGALLEAAGSFYTIHLLAPFVIEAEVTYSKAGNNAYRLQRNGEWFEEVTPGRVYADIGGERQDWLGEQDFAASLRLGYQIENTTPYLSYKYQGKHFIYRERESAHLLRTADETQSHGGLHRVGFGAYFIRDNFAINPEFEYFVAENPVFTNSTDVRQDRQLSSFEKQDFVIFLTVAYQYGDNKIFKP